MQISIYFLWFIFYSFVGWFYESTIISIPDYHKFINRGYLLGPYCPIYGAGAVINIIVLQDVNNTIAIFFIAVVTSSIVEYITSYAMEKLFHARWWDYSKYPLNLNGRICFYGAVVFGFGNVILLKGVHPYVRNFTNMIPSNMIQLSAILLFIVISLDTIFTTININSFNIKLKSIQENLNLKFNHSITSIVEKGRDLQENLKVLKKAGSKLSLPSIRNQFKKSELRILHAFPKFKSTRYSELVDKIKEILKEKL